MLNRHSIHSHEYATMRAVGKIIARNSGHYLFTGAGHINQVVVPIRSHIKSSIKAMVISPMMAESILDHDNI